MPGTKRGTKAHSTLPGRDHLCSDVDETTMIDFKMEA